MQSDVSNFRWSNFVPNALAIVTSATRNALHKVVAHVNSRLFAFALTCICRDARDVRWHLRIHNAFDWTGNVCKLLNVEWPRYRLRQAKRQKRIREKEKTMVQINVM